MLAFNTPGFKGFSVKWSPFFDDRLALATSQYYGLVGNGRLYVLGLGPQGILASKVFDTRDALYDVAWSEIHGDQLLTASGDGTVKLFDANVDQFPVAQWSEHNREVYSVHWNLTGKDTFLSSSWDGSVRIYIPGRDQSITVLPVASCTYSAQWSPHDNGIVSAVSSDSMIRLFDLRVPASAQNHLVLSMENHLTPPALPGMAPTMPFAPNEVLTHDWNKYRSTVIATGSTDRYVRTFDTRNPKGPLAILPGHEYAVRRVSWSPHLSDVLVSGSYDMTARVWTDGSYTGPPGSAPPEHEFRKLANGMYTYGGGREAMRYNAHTEFVTGADWSLFGKQGWVATTGWDERLMVWDVNCPQ
ncbi:MAG: hypothetical protein Q9162_005167 [Coniocarpon cinnabarinum]